MMKSCPQCARQIRGDDARLGYCRTCQEFTGLCAAGRRVVSGDALTDFRWRASCPKPATGPPRVFAGRDGRPQTMRFCQDHEALLAAGDVPYLREREIRTSWLA
jgi:hypothetical protein